jgi:hypothetical protein
MRLTNELPHVDEHVVEVEAGSEVAWKALSRVVESSVSTGVAPLFARLLGCSDVLATGPRPLAPGSTVPGFHVESARTPTELALAGRHRFSAYALIFRLEEIGGNRTRIRAETRAEFPGARGTVYRALVIGTGLHVLATHRILAAAKRDAERSR